MCAQTSFGGRVIRPGCAPVEVNRCLLTAACAVGAEENHQVFLVVEIVERDSGHMSNQIMSVDEIWHLDIWILLSTVAFKRGCSSLEFSVSNLS